jgi:DNA-binding MarR family transcriptional regulator
MTVLNFQKIVKTICGQEDSQVDAHPDLQPAAEQLAVVLTSHGLQRMTARVLATLLFTEQSNLTMGELTEILSASAGAISGALKMLTSTGLAERVAVPASRRDHYRLRDNAWAILFTGQNEVIAAMQAAADAGLAAADTHGAAFERLAQMRDFYAFLMAELPALLDRWHQQTAGQAARVPDRPAGTPRQPDRHSHLR